MINLVKSVSNRVLRRSSLSSSSSQSSSARKKASRFVERRQWDRLHDLLLTIEFEEEAAVGRSSAARGDLAERDGSDGSTILHFLCCYRPPSDVVRAACRLFPELVSARDDSSRVPLHFAVGFGASVDVVRILLRCDVACASMRDARGKTPLVVACEEMGIPDVSCPFDAYEQREDCEQVRRLAGVIDTLARACPQSVILTDDDGRTALEHALDSEAPMSTIRVLQHATIYATRGQAGAPTSDAVNGVPKEIDVPPAFLAAECQKQRRSDVSSLASRRSSSQLSAAAA